MLSPYLCLVTLEVSGVPTNCTRRCYLDPGHYARVPSFVWVYLCARARETEEPSERGKGVLLSCAA